MSLNAKNVKRPSGGGNRVEQPTKEPGTYPARVVQVLDLGLQPQKPYKGQEKSPKHEIMLTYELLDLFMVDDKGNELEDKPCWISETFPFNSLEADLAKSTKRYLAIDPDQDFEGDFTRLVGQPCMITIVLNKVGDKVYENVGNVTSMRARDKDKAPDLVNEPKVFELDNPDMEVFNKLPTWLQDKIKSNLNYASSPLQEALEGDRKATKGSAKGTAKKAAVEAPEQNQDDSNDDEGEPW